MEVSSYGENCSEKCRQFMTSIDFLKLVINVSLYTEMSQFFPMITLLYRSCRVLSRCLLLDISRLWPICKYRLFSLFPLRTYS